MPELNPYEPPQSELKRESSEPARASSGTRSWRYFVPSLIGLQITAGGLAFLFHVMQALAHSNYQRLQLIAAIFAWSYLVLGLLLFLNAFWRGSLKLIIFEVIAYAVFDWSTLLDFH